MRVISPLILLLSAAALPIPAQAGPAPDLLADWQRDRTTVLAYIDAMPDSVWTLGQLVPYLRLNGVTPPEYRMPF